MQCRWIRVGVTWSTMQHVVVIAVDCSGAFDTVRHKKSADLDIPDNV